MSCCKSSFIKNDLETECVRIGQYADIDIFSILELEVCVLAALTRPL